MSMKNILLIFRSSLEDFRRNKLRTFLTSLGILIGVCSVVLLMALGLGLRKYIQQQFESLGTNTIYVIPGNMEGGAMSRGGIGDIRFDDRDVSAVKRIRDIGMAVPLYSKTTKLHGLLTTKIYEIAAGPQDMFKILNLEVDAGRVFTKSDAEKGAKVVVLGPNVAIKLFGSVPAAINRTVDIENQGYKIVGVLKAKGGGGMGVPSVDDHVYMPFKAAASFNPSKKYMAIYVKADRKEDLPKIKADIKKTLSKRYKPEDFSVMEQTEILNTVNQIFSILNLVLVSIAAISLLVGGIGIMNIMFVSVVERIREIGIRRAIGATRQDILLQFLTESILLSMLGGVLGLTLAFLGVLAIKSVFPATIDVMTVTLAVGVSSAVGIIFGVIPARKAANLSPIEAIRYE